MNDSAPFWQTKRFWGSLVMLLSMLGVGSQVPPEQWDEFATQAVAVTTAIGWIVNFIGGIVAKRKMTLKKGD